MASETLSRTNLWKHAFENRGDGDDRFRERFQSALLRFRERVGNLLTFIPGDMRQYTVHDLSHLDALWEMAQLIAGEDFSLNPAEAFVFGGAVLLHDAGMSVAAYPGGLDAIKNLREWNDSYSWACMAFKADPVDSVMRADVRDLAITDVLRKKHASKAQELATQTWVNPSDLAQDYLLEDSDLRAHFGPTIGAIAHSHHWSIKKLISELQSTLGAFGEMPSEWSVDCVKVALLLRCADAAHLDHRRAPRLLFALTQPKGVANAHWTFQAKLAKPQVQDGKLLYTSRSPFCLDDVNPWHLCWDMMKMVDRELSDSRDLLLDRRSPVFAISGVIGAKSADALAKHVKVEGWRPIPTELQVSDVPHLARTLGGADLYSLPSAPLRELLQNAADAIDARSALDNDFSPSDAKITVRLANSVDGVILSVEDDGLGMSEKTLTGALLDFGTSFWKSDRARNEFPGLQAEFNPRGRYGIGFFSIFMWADCVKVSTRKFTEGVSDAKVLEFISGLGSRPILRPAASGEASTRFNTKITLQIPSAQWEKMIRVTANPSIYSRRVPSYNEHPLISENSIARLTAMLKIPVYFEDSNVNKLVNLPDWETAPTDKFISFIEGLDKATFPDRIRKFAKSEALVREDGKIVGRAFLRPLFGNRGSNLAHYEMGIFIGYRQVSSVYGFIEGRATNAARDRVEGFNVMEDAEWVGRQIDYMTRLSENVGDKIACQEALVDNGEIATTLPIVLLNRKELSLEELSNEVSKRDVIKFSLRDGSEEDGFSAAVLDSASPFIGKEIDENRLYFLIPMADRVRPDDLLSFVDQGKVPLSKVFRIIKNSLGEHVQIRSALIEADNYSRRKILSVEFSRVSALGG